MTERFSKFGINFDAFWKERPLGPEGGKVARMHWRQMHKLLDAQVEYFVDAVVEGELILRNHSKLESF